MATHFAAHHLVEGLTEHSAEIVGCAKIGAPPSPAVRPRSPLTLASLCCVNADPAACRPLVGCRGVLLCIPPSDRKRSRVARSTTRQAVRRAARRAGGVRRVGATSGATSGVRRAVRYAKAYAARRAADDAARRAARVCTSRAAYRACCMCACANVYRTINVLAFMSQYV